FPSVTKYLNQQVRSSVDHLRAVREAFDAVHEPIYHDNVIYSVEGTQLSLDRREGVEGADLCRFVGTLYRLFFANFACVGHFPITDADSPRKVEEIAGSARWQVITGRCRRRRERVAEFCYLFFYRKRVHGIQNS